VTAIELYNMLKMLAWGGGRDILLG
jgi:hypothetical protein